MNVRTLAFATAVGLAALGLTAAPAATASGSTFVLTGDHTASVEVTVGTPWHVSAVDFGAANTATFAGTYAGFLVERAPDLPGDYPVLKYGMVFLVGHPDPVWFGGYEPLRPDSNEYGKMEAGTYRLTLFADGPSTVSIAVDGTESRDFSPADPVTATAQAADLAPTPGGTGNDRSVHLRGLPAGPETLAILTDAVHFKGTLELDTCFAATALDDTPGCPWSDPRTCGGSWEFPGSPDVDGTATTSEFRPPGETFAGQYVVPPVDPGDTYAKKVEPIVQYCPFREGDYDAVVAASATSWSTTEPSTAFALFVRPAPMRSVVERAIPSVTLMAAGNPPGALSSARVP